MGKGFGKSIEQMISGSPESNDMKRIKESTQNALGQIKAQIGRSVDRLKKGGKFDVQMATNDVLDASGLPDQLRLRASLYVKKEIQRALLMATNPGMALAAASKLPDSKTVLGKLNKKIHTLREKFGVDKGSFNKMMVALVGYLGPKSLFGKFLEHAFHLKPKPKAKASSTPASSPKATTGAPAGPAVAPKKPATTPAAAPSQTTTTPAKAPETQSVRLTRYADAIKKQGFIFDSANGVQDYAWLKQRHSGDKFDKALDIWVTNATSTNSPSGKVLQAVKLAMKSADRSKFKLRLKYLELNAITNPEAIKVILKSVSNLKNKSSAQMEKYLNTLVETKKYNLAEAAIK